MTRLQQIRNVDNLLSGQRLILTHHLKYQTPLPIALHFHTVWVEHIEIDYLTAPVAENPDESVTVNQERHQDTLIEGAVTVEVHIRLPHP